MDSEIFFCNNVVKRYIDILKQKIFLLPIVRKQKPKILGDGDPQKFYNTYNYSKLNTIYTSYTPDWCMQEYIYYTLHTVHSVVYFQWDIFLWHPIRFYKKFYNTYN